MGHHKSFVDNPNIDKALTDRVFKIGIGVAVVGLGATLASLAMGEEGRKQFFFSWLTGFSFFTTITLGCLFFTIIHHLTRATWSAGWRRIAEMYAGNIVLMAVLFGLVGMLLVAPLTLLPLWLLGIEQFIDPGCFIGGEFCFFDHGFQIGHNIL